MRIIVSIFLAALFCTHGFSQGVDKPDHIKGKNAFASNICMAKGGIGVITMNLHIDLKSDRNKLILSAGETWTGQGVPTTEMVIVFEGKVWSAQTLPEGFDLSKAVVVSFETDKVRFFNFGNMTGGYYARPPKD